MSDTGKILVIDDETNIRRMLAMVLEGEGFDVVSAASAEDGLATLARTPVDAVMLDVCMPGMDGIACLRAILEEDPDLPVVMISGHATVNDAVEATRIGAFDFLEKPLSRERVLVTIRNCVRTKRDKTEIQVLRSTAKPVGSEMLGRTPAMDAMRQHISKVAPTRARVLITGESGTGKELVARAIHEASDRAERAFIKVNCAAIPADLIESTLFGHEKGAFTSAVGRRRGNFELADKGTLFLDEVGDMALSAQAKVLRVLQSGELTRVGGESPISVDVRVVAATNKDLEAACKDGTFREDLYFRLNVVPLQTPPLRARRNDIPILVESFLAEVCAENNFKRKSVHPEVMRRLVSFDWPGNVRELRNVVERLAILSDDQITPEDLPADFTQRARAGLGAGAADLFTDGTLREFREAAEREFIEARLIENDWNISRTADTLGLERTNLHKKIKALGLHRDG